MKGKNRNHKQFYKCREKGKLGFRSGNESSKPREKGRWEKERLSLDHSLPMM